MQISAFSHSAWTWNDDRQQYYLHQFDTLQPDLNYREPRVVQAMKDVLTFWMEKGADGFRVDAVNNLFEDPAFRDEPLSGNTDDPTDSAYLNHIYTIDLVNSNIPLTYLTYLTCYTKYFQEETFNMVGEWRTLIDEYTADKGGDTRVIFIEAWTTIQNTVRFYADSEGKPRSHFPFNFFLITELNLDSTPRDFKQTIDKWISHMPIGATPNWVVSESKHS